MKSLVKLIECLPSWAELGKQTKKKLRIVAGPPLADGTPSGRKFQLVIRQYPKGHITVKEAKSERQLPQCCVERHINADGTFCLYLDSTKPISDQADAEEWWRGIHAFLNHQVFAERWQYWPPNAQLSHGSAAATQISMENVAGDFGWTQEVLDGIFLNRGWLGSDLLGLAKGDPKVVNSRSACPRGCMDRHKPASRKNCMSERCGADCNKQHLNILRANCPQRRDIEKLILLEHKRRGQEKAFVQSLKKKGTSCCGTMKSCPLR